MDTLWELARERPKTLQVSLDPIIGFKSDKQLCTCLLLSYVWSTVLRVTQPGHGTHGAMTLAPLTSPEMLETHNKLLECLRTHLQESETFTDSPKFPNLRQKPR